MRGLHGIPATSSGVIAVQGRFYSPFLACGGAWVAVHHGDVATVLTLRGEIDAANAELVVDTLRPLVAAHCISQPVAGSGRVGAVTPPAHPVVLDISELSFLSVAGFRALLTLDAERQTGRAPWAIVYGAAMRPFLRAMPEIPLPLAGSGVEALRHLEPVMPC